MSADDYDPSPSNDELEAHLQTRNMVVNLGPSHPAMHGTVRMKVELDGETIVKVDTEIGFLHRGFQKSCENVTWTQCIPYTDRLNYVSALGNNFGFIHAVEELMGIEIPERAKYIRVIGAELHRICDHLTATGALGLELGAFAAFLYGVEARELLWDRVTELTGARLTTNFGRIGGLNRDMPPTWPELVEKTLKKTEELTAEVDALLTRNRIFVDRCRGTGIITTQDALDFGFTGPCLRANGVKYDVRKAKPYWVYDRLDFDVPVGASGDNYDRYLCRTEELRQSIKMVRQCFKEMPEGPVIVDDWRVVLPPKQEVYSTIEGVMAHFKLVMEGIQVPSGEVYSCTEGANGELGWYLRSDGSGRPYKVHVRAPGFHILSGVNKMIEGRMLADLVPTFDTINMIGGEVEQ
ncbi:MAG: NADH-quinone oxidoreductase subunit D [Myxococcaceae bacterium]|nr:NADH-quinone oxidoreductase subunit D [Myxococcaceae bacterium]